MVRVMHMPREIGHSLISAYTLEIYNDDNLMSFAQLRNSALATIPLMRHFSLMYKLLRLLATVVQHGTTYHVSDSLSKSKIPTSLKMLMGCTNSKVSFEESF